MSSKDHEVKQKLAQALLNEARVALRNGDFQKLLEAHARSMAAANAHRNLVDKKGNDISAAGRLKSLIAEHGRMGTVRSYDDWRAAMSTVMEMTHYLNESLNDSFEGQGLELRNYLSEEFQKGIYQHVSPVSDAIKDYVKKQTTDRIFGPTIPENMPTLYTDIKLNEKNQVVTKLVRSDNGSVADIEPGFETAVREQFKKHGYIPYNKTNSKGQIPPEKQNVYVKEIDSKLGVMTELNKKDFDDITAIMTSKDGLSKDLDVSVEARQIGLSR
ncbi:MAG: hypothetical protein WC627_06555 [Legionella sp.]|jgi:hypothetical protein